MNLLTIKRESPVWIASRLQIVFSVVVWIVAKHYSAHIFIDDIFEWLVVHLLIESQQSDELVRNDMNLTCTRHHCQR